jgi:16S rRNA (uracil1498-N3)-methyltransferase
MIRVYMPDVTAGATTLEVRGDEAHHLSRVVRARVGDRIGVFDGRGREWRAHVVEVTRQAVTLDVETEVQPVPEPPVRVTLAVGVLKGDQMDTVVRDATVMGVTHIVPVVTEHVVVSARAWREDGALARWQRVAAAAAKQCQRAVVPTIAGVTPVADLLEAQDADLTLVCVEPSATGPVAAMWRKLAVPSSVLMCVGPEGGWSGAEVATFGARGAHAVSLGPRTLRAEAVPAVALTMLWATWGWTS